jgi:RNA polymerase sigma-70 factor (ECF subfamily)
VEEHGVTTSEPDTDSEPDTEELIRRAASGDADAMSVLFLRYRDQLTRFVELRLDPRFNARVGASDIVQLALMTAEKRLPEYCRKRPMGFAAWLRALALDKLRDLARRHTAKRRTVHRQEALNWSAEEHAAAAGNAALIGKQETPSFEVRRKELQRALRETLDQLGAVDREVLALRHEKGLSNRVVAEALQISESAASKRYMTALARLREGLQAYYGSEDIADILP